MSDQYIIRIFGKEGCGKCRVLNQRVEKLLAANTFPNIEKEYCDLGTSEGLIEFCRAECLNPQRLPALMVLRNDVKNGPTPVPNPEPGREDDICGDSMLYQYMGLQTDYSEKGKGLITPGMLKHIIAQSIS